MKVVLLSSDLMLAAAVQGDVDRHGASLAIVQEPDESLAACSQPDAGLLVVDLRTPRLDIATFVDDVRRHAQRPVHVLAFAPHVHEAALELARAAGCDQVVSRGQVEQRFAATLDSLMKSFEGAPPR